MASFFRILSIDGGGIRGIIPAMVMAEIEKRTEMPIHKLFDLIAGTSTGGVLALGVTTPHPDDPTQAKFTAKQGVELYEQQGHRIFDHSLLQKFRSGWNITDEKYPSAAVETVLKESFGDAYLHEALTNVLITSYEIERRIPWFFHSSRAKVDPNYDFKVWQVARATSAAPTYFEPAKIEVGGLERYYALVDGGMFANNPAMCALVEARTTHPETPNVLVVSLGTGQASRRIPYDEAKNWGLVKWVQPIVDILIHGVGDTIDFQMRQLLPELDGKQCYYRFDAQLTDDHTEDLDNTDPDNIRALGLVGEKVIDENNAALGVLCKQLVELTSTG
jgi:patatin-like phospholipase/acyl hydrolase